MAGNFLLDTSVAVALIGNDAFAQDQLATAGEVFIPTPTLGELYYGANKSVRPREEFERIEEFVSNIVVLACDTETARRYGEVKNALRLKGRPIPENDIWIAAIAIQHDLQLATRDAHFREVPNLKIFSW